MQSEAGLSGDQKDASNYGSRKCSPDLSVERRINILDRVDVAKGFSIEERDRKVDPARIDIAEYAQDASRQEH